MGYSPSPAELHTSIAAANLRLTSPFDDFGQPAPSSRADLLARFGDVFREAPAATRRDLEEAFRLRYEVYCLDRGFEDSSTCPDGMERDHYDDFAYHTLLRNRLTDQVLGTVRLVRPAATPNWVTQLPLSEYADFDSVGEIMRLPAGATAEVSRFAISRAARRTLCQPRGETRQCSGQWWPQKMLPYMSLGLIRGLVRMSREHGITHWCLAAEPSLLRRLRSFGLHFKDAGPLVEHRGLRQICYAELDSLLDRAEAEQPECWEILTDAGTFSSLSFSRDSTASAQVALEQTAA